MRTLRVAVFTANSSPRPDLVATTSVYSPASSAEPNAAFTVDPQRLHGKSRNAVYKGKTLFGQVEYTLLGGKIVYKRGE